MPPVNTQGSRAGLITTLVISIVLLMVSLIMWIYANSQWTKAETENKTLHQKYDTVVSSTALTAGGAVEELTAAKDKLGPELQGNTSVDVAIAEIKRLTRTISKEATSYMAADQAAGDAIRRAETALAKRSASTTQPTTAPVKAAGASSLVAELDKISTALDQEVKTNQSVNATVASMKGQLDQNVANWNDQFAKINESFTAEHNRAEAASNQALALKTDYEKKTADAATSANSIAAQAGGRANDLQTQLNAMAGTLAAAVAKQKELASIVQRFNVKDASVRQPDGTIVRVPSSNVCYIDLGQGDHLPVGITFEVYDKNEGIPGPGTDPQATNNLPVGKASIEVVRVGQNSSECRVVHQTAGTTLSEGDLIANLIYDRNMKLNFVVYGRFDVNGDNKATIEEGQVVKSLVTRWGGKVQDAIGANTDFLVVGAEPEPPALTKEQREDPILARGYEEAVKESKEYSDLLARASELHIPVMNQNRFMYYIGYYDQLKR